METLRINIYGEITEDTAKTVRSQLSVGQYEAVELYINSPGGSVFDGLAIHNAIKATNKPSKAIIEGFCASIATVIALACDKVAIMEAAIFMVHNAWSTVSGNSAELAKVSTELAKLDVQLKQIYKTKTGKSETEVDALMANEAFLSPAEAKELGFVDEILPNPTLKAVAFINQNTIMDAQKKKEGLTLLASLKKFLGMEEQEPKAMEIMLEDGTMLFVETEDGEFVGKRVYVVGEEGTQTPAPDGNHRLNDGRTITVVDGVITAVKEDETDEPESDPAASYKQEIEALKARLDAMEKEKEAQAQAIEAAKAEARKLDAFLASLNEGPEPKGKPNMPKAESKPASAWAESTAAAIKSMMK